MFDLTALRKIYDTGKARDVYVAGRSGSGVEALGNLVEAVLEQVPVEVERHCGRLVSEHLLDDLDVGSCGDRQRGCGVAETMGVPARRVPWPSLRDSRRRGGSLTHVAPIRSTR